MNDACILYRPVHSALEKNFIAHVFAQLSAPKRPNSDVQKSEIFA